MLVCALGFIDEFVLSRACLTLPFYTTQQLLCIEIYAAVGTLLKFENLPFLRLLWYTFSLKLVLLLFKL